MKDNAPYHIAAAAAITTPSHPRIVNIFAFIVLTLALAALLAVAKQLEWHPSEALASLLWTRFECTIAKAIGILLWRVTGKNRMVAAIVAMFTLVVWCPMIIWAALVYPVDCLCHG